MNDDETIARVLAGDTDVFRDLVVRYQRLVFSLVMRQVPDRATAEDLSQEVFIRAFKGLKQFRKEAKFSTWLCQITINHLQSYFASSRFKQSKITESLEVTKHDRISEGDDVEQKRKELQSAVRTLDATYRDVITLCAFEGHSYEQVAAMLKIPVGTVRSRLNKARLLLRESLSPRLSAATVAEEPRHDN